MRLFLITREVKRFAVPPHLPRPIVPVKQPLGESGIVEDPSWVTRRGVCYHRGFEWFCEVEKERPSLSVRLELGFDFWVMGSDPVECAKLFLAFLSPFFLISSSPLR